MNTLRRYDVLHIYNIHNIIVLIANTGTIIDMYWLIAKIML